jgi:hypothetical protein
MPVATMSAVERIARVIAGMNDRNNANGEACGVARGVSERGSESFSTFEL